MTTVRSSSATTCQYSRQLVAVPLLISMMFQVASSHGRSPASSDHLATGLILTVVVIRSSDTTGSLSASKGVMAPSRKLYDVQSQTSLCVRPSRLMSYGVVLLVLTGFQVAIMSPIGPPAQPSRANEPLAAPVPSPITRPAPASVQAGYDTSVHDILYFLRSFCRPKPYLCGDSVLSKTVELIDYFTHLYTGFCLSSPPRKNP